MNPARVYVRLINLYVEEENAKTTKMAMNVCAAQDSLTMVTSK